MCRPPCRLIQAGSSTFATAIPATTSPVSTTNTHIAPTHGRAARPMSVSTVPAAIVLVSPRRSATGTAPRPNNAKRNPGIAVITPAHAGLAPNAARVSSSTGPTDEMPARRFTATAITAANRSVAVRVRGARGARRDGP